MCCVRVRFRVLRRRISDLRFALRAKVRLLFDELLPYDDVKAAIIGSTQTPHGPLSASDLRLLGKVLSEIATTQAVSRFELTPL